jgi:hypothetical protein|tara:strand:- start:947 stop:1837 length:891 start_codon:yes stop_codon:yes gene_type:complete
MEWYFKMNIIPTVNSLSGGKTSSYMAVHYPADYNIFALIRTNDKSCQYPDKKLRQVVSDKIGCEFMGTLEDDVIIHTMLDLEQFIGQEIIWVTGINYDELVYTKNGKVNLPDAKQRSCTSTLKYIPIQQYWYDNIKVPVEMRIGFRANETKRAKTILDKTNKDGFTESRIIVGQRETKVWKKKWQVMAWRKPVFPLIDDNIYKDNIESYWSDKNIRFAYMNNCIGCFHRNPVLLKLMSDKFPDKFEWFNKAEKNALEYKNMTWKEGMTYEQIKNTYSQRSLFDDDFDECDSGHCGI